MDARRISILGVGLLGGSIGLAVRSAIKGCSIVGYGHRTSTLEAALKRGVIDEGFDKVDRAVEGADLVILCTPVGTFNGLLPLMTPALTATAIVTDVGSTKRSVVRWANEHLPRPERFVGSHPMAGSEKRGVEFARADLFQNAVCLTTPTAETDGQVLETVERFWRLLGMRLTRLSPDEHDRLIGRVSHLPHAVAAALVAMQSDASLGLAGKGFMDATRIAGGDGGLWRDILVDNRDNVREGIEQLKGQLDRLLGLLEKEDGIGVEEWLSAAAERRAGMG